MDEADILADRKIIISDGKIRCSGSSVYLKNHFNMQYLLNIETKMKYKNEITEVVLKHIPEAKYINNSNYNNQGNEKDNYCYTWSLPMSLTNKYFDLLNELESLKGKILNQISLDSPYLEDLFIKVTSENFEKRNSDNDLIPDFHQTQNLIENHSLPKLKDVKKKGFINKTLRFIKYRFLLLMRNLTFLLIYIAVPLVVLGFTVFSIKDHLNENMSVNFHEKDVSSPKLYSGYQLNYDIKNSNINDKVIKELFDKTV
jgi:ATP-binding cassette subfamily A (ABC1) protein 5